MAGASGSFNPPQRRLALASVPFRQVARRRQAAETGRGYRPRTDKALHDDHRPYHAVYRPPYPGLDYRAARPFARWAGPHLLASMREWLGQNPPRLELATLALEELRQRSKGEAAAAPVTASPLQADMTFSDSGLEPIVWLQPARMALARAFPADWPGWSAAGRRGGTVYAILRDGYVAPSGRFTSAYGVYVGSTTKPLEKRFMEHRQSSRAGRGMQAHGIEPLFSLCLPLTKAPRRRSDLRGWETRLHHALATVIPRVSGDTVDEVPKP